MKDKEKQIETEALIREYNILSQSFVKQEEKQIEEKAKDKLIKIILQSGGITINMFGRGERIVRADVDKLTNNLIESGLIIPEGSVVLSTEEYEEYKQFQTFLDEYEFENVQDMEDTLNICQKLLYERLKQAHKKGSKKTAEKYCELKKYLVELHCECLKAKTENSGKYEKANTSSDRDRYYIESHKVNANIELIKKIINKFDELAKQFGV